MANNKVKAKSCHGAQGRHISFSKYLYNTFFLLKPKFQSLNTIKSQIHAIHLNVYVTDVIMHPFEAQRAEAVLIGNAAAALVFSRKFSVWILILHILQVTKGSYSLFQLLQVTTGIKWHLL